ncbi:glycosyltransferase family 4 protein [Komagataeibacter swingsii]|uniref:Glycosyl transferase n=1 Tax=Komagataeibacter swingsii TaxID=215220 RepID=A0A2V4R310_9PROT|nr:glycosyltransferase family 4 protein [Komagataeibacter swingsii]PYD71407.1 glycosyl transferase [Komagataeibacter swingsii]GBQ55512.1 glycosyltransferase [Komagataeibacter swingsii DSM 16373]
MRIVYIINSLNGGGAERPLPDIVAQMRACGHDVHVLALARKAGNAVAWLQEAGIAYDILSPDPDKFASLRTTLAAVRRHAPDLIWTSLTRATLYGQMAGVLLRRPVVSWQHNAYLRPWNRRLLHATHSLTDLWVADSPFVAKCTARQLNVPQRDVITWPLFTAQARMPQAVPWAGADDGRAVFRLGTLGRLEPQKNYGLLIQAMAWLRDHAPQCRIHLDIGGEGSLAPQLRTQIMALGLDNVTLSGFQADPFTYCAGLHGYVQPSLFEGLCIALHEAMQAGVPSIVTPVGAMADVVRDGESGLFLDPATPERLASLLLRLYDDPALCARMGTAARRQILSSYNLNAITAQARAVMERAEQLVATQAGASRAGTGHPTAIR